MTLTGAKMHLLKKLIHPGSEKQIMNMVEKFKSDDFNDLLSELGDNEIKLVAECIFRSPKLYKILLEIPEVILPDLIEMVDDAILAPILLNSSDTVTSTIVRKLPKEKQEQIFKHLPIEHVQNFLRFIMYADDSCGYISTTDYFSADHERTAGQAIEELRQFALSEKISYVYVLENKVLVGIVPLRNLFLSSPNLLLKDIMTAQPIAVNANDDREKAAQLVSQYNFLALPVVNDAFELIGIIRVDDIVDIIRDEFTEDIQKIGGTEALEEPYISIPFLGLIKKRAGWLVILFLSEMFTATAMGFFQDKIERAVILALFVPLIISSGGNSGSQASSLVIRALAIGEIALKDWVRVFKRELAAGLALGAILGSIGFLRITAWSFFSDIYGPHWFLVATTIFFSLIGVVLWGTIVGSMLPFTLKRLGFDPASSSAPFVATLVDVTGLIIYFSVASLILLRALQ